MRRKGIMLLATLLSICAVQTRADVGDAFHDVLPVTDETMKMSLNGIWQLKVVEGTVPGNEVPQPDDTWGYIPVPGCWETYGFSQPNYDKARPLTGYYRTEFEVPDTWKGQCIMLRLDGVLYGYDLWINGQWAGTWRSAYNTALFDITPYIDRRRGKQQLALRVITVFPGSEFDYNDDWAPCGIFRDVTLFAIPPIHLADLTISTRMTGEVDIQTRIAGDTRHTRVEYCIEEEGLKADGPHARLRVDVPRLWTAETPNLYTLTTRLYRKGRLLQQFRHRFGIRELSIEGNVLKLNGRPIKLRGVTSHSTDPRTVKVIDDTLTLKDMRMMKEASVNYIRTSHYPREPRFYELADSLGFYVIDEVPFGYGDRLLSDSAFYETLQQRAQATIRRDKNHACVLIWSLGNENPLTDMCVQLGQYVKEQLDTVRPICYPQVGSYFRRFNFQFPHIADIYAPHYPSVGQVAGFYQRSDRPVIFTEYCHTLGTSFEDHDLRWETIEHTPCLAGGSVWEWVDQGMPFKSEPTDGYGYEERVFTSATEGFEMEGNKGADGLLYANRVPLPNYYEMQHNYARACVTDSVLKTTDDEAGSALQLHIRNRYDFIDLEGNVSFRWAVKADRDTLAQGRFSPRCAPRQETIYRLSLPVRPDSVRMWALELELSDKEGHTFLHQAVPIGRQSLMPRLLKGLDLPTGNPLDYVQGPLLVRAGRKATMAERLTIKDKRLERYLLRLSDDGKQAGDIATRIETQMEGNALHVNFSLTPDTTETFLSELGLAMLLDKRIDRVQWIGQGPWPTYPGRSQAGHYGLHGLQRNDLYFEGNRHGLEATLLTDAQGNGVLLVCRRGDVSFEQTDHGIVLTYNAAVAGLGPKSSRTAYPVVARTAGTVEGDFYLYRVDADKTPRIISELFDAPNHVPMPFHPFVTQYDTYLLRFADIVVEGK
ncbi:MAG: hypothetical protein IJT19_04870 [Bacteroidaceae bacterium]|nr:hypothetical protein [Bacteroidaceae bacterium]